MAISPIIPVQSRGGRRTSLIPLAAAPTGDGCFFCDFSTGSLPSGFSFSRSGTAWFVNSSGYLEQSSNGNPRFEYDPSQVTPTCRGLVMEPQRTNLALYSENMAGASWALQGEAYLNGETVVSPKNNALDDIQIQEGEDVVSVAGISQTIGTTAGQSYTFSLWVKPSGTNAFGVSIYWNANYYLYFNVSTVLDPLQAGVNYTLTNANNMVPSVRREVYKNGWYRYSISFTHPSAVVIQNSIPITPDFGIYIQSTDAFLNLAVRTLSIFGVQLETGTGSTSYIPTTGSTATRNQDSLTVSDITAFNFNTTNSSIVLKGLQRSWGSSYARTFRFSGSGINEALAMPVDGVTLFGSSRNSSYAVIAEGTRTNTLLSDFIFGYSVDTSLTTATAVTSLNGSTTTNNRQNAGPMATPTQLQFNANSSATAYAAMILRSLKYCPVSRTSSEMTALTTP